MELKLRKMMVVEDMEPQREYMVSLLSYLSEDTVFSAENGLAASKILRQHHQDIDLIFTDLQMPEMDGLELIEFLGEINYQGCIFICSYMEQKVIDLAIELARRKSIHLIGCLDKALNEEIVLLMFQRVLSVRLHYFNHLQVLNKDQLLSAFKSKNIVPFFQPQIDFKTNSVKGFEVLSRIILPGSNQVIYPDSFIPFVNKVGLANMLTFALMERAIEEFKCILKISGEQELDLSINICPSQLDDDDMPIKMQQLCLLHDFSAKRLIIEITESDVIETDKRLKNLDRLRLMGFGCSLDDFGMGFTSIRQLNIYPFTEVKMDKSLLLGISHDQYSKRLYEQIYQIAQSHGLKMVVEGIETDEHKLFLERFSDIVLQGYLISRPQPIDEIKRWYNAWLKQNP